MAILWDGSAAPFIDPTGAPYAGAKAYFFDAGTTTPQIVYTDAALSIPHDHPVVADSSGWFPAVFLTAETTHRLRILDADDVTLRDIDNISVPTTVAPTPPEGDTAAEFLFQTGDIKMAWRSAAPDGYVRLNGRTIGSATSGATERANADCEDLFVFLWEQDANLSVSGGRGATSAGDWAAAKTIALPDWRGRAPVGLDGMGNTVAGRITDALTDGGDADALGETAGEATHVLVEGELAPHTHVATVTDPGHTHTPNAGARVLATPVASTTFASLGGGLTETTLALEDAETGITVANSSTGSGTAHNNLQPSVLVPFFIKL